MFFFMDKMQVLSFDIWDPMSRIDRMSPSDGPERIKVKGKDTMHGSYPYQRIAVCNTFKMHLAKIITEFPVSSHCAVNYFARARF